MTILSPKYATIRRVFIIVGLLGMFFVPGVLWLPTVLDSTNAVIMRSPAYVEWQRYFQAQPDGFSRFTARLEFFRIAAMPVLAKQARRHILWLIVTEIGWLVSIILLYPRAKELYDRLRERPAGGKWATRREILRRFSSKSGEITAYVGMLRSDGMLGRLIRKGYTQLRIPFSLLREGFLVIGGTGAGKTWGVLIPMLLSLARQREVSVIAVDIKFGEKDCLSIASRYWARYGPVVAWNPWDPNSVRIDVMAGVDTQGDIRDQVAILMGHSPTQAAEDIQFWSSNEAQVLDVLLNAAKLEGRHMDRVRELSYLMPEQLQRYIATIPVPELRRKLDRFFGVNYDKQAGTLQGLEKYLSDWDDPNVVRATTPGSPDETFDLRRIFREHIFFVVAIPQEKFVSGHALLMFRLIIRMITKMLLSSRQPGENQKVVLILEEFPQLEKIPYFNRFLSTCRSRGVATVVTAQGMHQGYAEYGRDTFLGLLNNFRTRMVFPVSLSPEEAEYFSRLFGKSTIDTLSWGASPGGARVGASESTKPLVPQEEMHWKWKSFEAIVHTSGIPDFTVYCPPAITISPFREWLVDAAHGAVMVEVDETGDRRSYIVPPTMPELMEDYRKRMGERAFYETIMRMEAFGQTSGGMTEQAAAVQEHQAVPESVVDNVEPAIPEPAPVPSSVQVGPAAVKSPASGPGTGRATGAEIVRMVATALLELAASDPQSTSAVEVKAGKGKTVSYMLLPRGVLEEIFGVDRLQRELTVWMDYGWVTPRPAERLRFERQICQMLPPDLAERLVVAFVYRRRGQLQVPQAQQQKSTASHEAAVSRLRDICRWVADSLEHFEGSPVRDGTELYGVYEEGVRVGIIPHVLHRVMGSSREENWAIWAKWRDAGWTEVSERDRLTAVVRMKDRGTQRLVVIRWSVFQAALSGAPIEPQGQLELVKTTQGGG